MDFFLSILKGILKILWKIFLIALYAIGRISEGILKEVNKILSDAIK